MKYLILLLLLLPAGLMEAAPAHADTPRWPLDLKTRYLTSNFMEYRGGRYHAGLDLKTNSRQGFAVHAVEDGYISRVRCTPTAYGRVVYLRGDSGRTFVFAHLQRFNDDLRRRVQQNQAASGQYRTSLYFQPDEIRIHEGDVLGLSGQSGTSGPHLHFEVRDRSQRPRDPQAEGFGVVDTLAPVIHGLRAWPASEEARVFGDRGEWVYSASEDGGLKGDIGVLVVSGPVAFSARVVEATDVAGHRLEPWLLELHLDGEMVYRCANEVFSFEENAQQRLEWTDAADWTDGGIPREHWLHRRAGVSLPGREGDLWYLGKDGNGLAAGLHHLELRAEDRAGNTAVVRWQVLVTRQVPSGETSPWRREPLGVRPEDHEGLALTPFCSTGDPGQLGLERRILQPGEAPVMEPLEMWSGPSEARFLDPQFAEAQGLRALGSQAVYLTADWPVEGALDVSWPDTLEPAEGEGELGVYRLKKRREWEFVENIRPEAGLTFHLEEPGVHAIFRDVQGPQLTGDDQPLVVVPGPAGTVPGVTLPRWGSTPLEAWDGGSGLDTGSIVCELDGVRIIVEPDPPRDRLLVPWPDGMSAGEHSLVLAVTDRAGHTTRRVYRVLATEERE